LDELRDLVRSRLSKIGRQILSALIVIEVHARDVVSNMLDADVCNVNDFEWISQLRSAHFYLCIFHQLVAWHSGRTSVSGRRTFPVLRSTCS